LGQCRHILSSEYHEKRRRGARTQGNEQRKANAKKKKRGKQTHFKKLKKVVYRVLFVLVSGNLETLFVLNLFLVTSAPECCWSSLYRQKAHNMHLITLWNHTEPLGGHLSLNTWTHKSQLFVRARYDRIEIDPIFDLIHCVVTSQPCEGTWDLTIGVTHNSLRGNIWTWPQKSINIFYVDYVFTYFGWLCSVF